MSLQEALERRAERVAALKSACAPIFERSKNITLEIGCGKGHYLSSYAAKFPGEICVVIDLISKRIEDARRRAKKVHHKILKNFGKRSQNSCFCSADVV